MIPVFCIFVLLMASIAPILLHKKDRIIITATQMGMLTLILVISFFVWYQSSGLHYSWLFLSYNQINLRLSIQFDVLAKLMCVFILIIGFFIYRYAQNYLESDQTRIRFLSQFNLVLCSVLLLVISANLLTAFIAWQFIGINLYLLLNHYHNDPFANRAAKKKFVINRIGDCCFLLAIIVAYRSGSDSSFAAIHLSGHAELICALLFVSVMTKCAQFPFHIWLIDTMETPTPVSALMHAGVINAGGILLTRVSASLIHFHFLLYFILLVGLVSAALSIQWMNRQPDTKKKLAYSTMGQMGYMLTQCSLGAFPAAIFHLISHGFYKASLFLNAGETARDPQDHANNRLTFPLLIQSLIPTAVIFCLCIFLFRHESGNIPLLMYGFIFMTLLTLIIKTDTTITSTLPIRLFYYLLIAILLLTYFYCFHLFSRLLPQYEDTGTIPHIIQAVLVAGLVAIQSIIWLKGPTLSLFKWTDKTEFFLRKYSLNPLRSIGNIINNSEAKQINMLSYLVVLIFSIACLAYGFYQHVSTNVTANQVLMCIFLLIGIAALVFANRCLSIKSLVAYLLLFELAFTNLAWFDGATPILKIGIYHLINISTVLIMLALLTGTPKNHNPLTKDTNRLPSRLFYLTVGLLLLIGIPGSASFISEFYLLNTLMNTNPIFILMYIALIILIAIVVMHSLQLYVFNKKYVMLLSSKISKRDHGIFLGAIILNIACGIFPHTVLGII